MSKTRTAIFLGIGKVEITEQRALQILRLQKLIKEQREQTKTKEDQSCTKLN